MHVLKPGVDFIKVGRKARIIEIALSICALRLRLIFWGAFYWRESSAQGCRAQKRLWNQPRRKDNKNIKYCVLTVSKTNLIFFTETSRQVEFYFERKIQTSYNLMNRYSGNLSSKLVWYLNGPEKFAQKVVRYLGYVLNS